MRKAPYAVRSVGGYFYTIMPAKYRIRRLTELLKRAYNFAVRSSQFAVRSSQFAVRSSLFYPLIPIKSSDVSADLEAII